MDRRQLHPYTRLLLLVSGIIGTAWSQAPLPTAVFETILLVILAINSGIRLIVIFLMIVLLPMTVMLTVFHLFVHSLNGPAFMAQMLTILKLAVYTTLIQIALIIPLPYVHFTFRKWGFRKDSLLILVSSYFVWMDVVKRSERILLARFSQGYIEKRTFMAKLRQIPFLLVPLIIGIMRTAAERSQSWDEKGLVERLETVRFSPVRGTNAYNFTIVCLALSWLVYNGVLLINRH